MECAAELSEGCIGRGSEAEVAAVAIAYASHHSLLVSSTIIHYGVGLLIQLLLSSVTDFVDVCDRFVGLL